MMTSWRNWRPFALALAMAAATSSSLADTAVPSNPAALVAGGGEASQLTQQQIAQLISALGSQRYVARREAEQRLLEIGMRAFDQIDAATDHPDPEVAARCRYLISELTVHWTRRDDPPQVKSALTDYANQTETQRLAVVRELGLQSDAWAIAPLCRVCRYDQSMVVARRAAIELLHIGQVDPGYTPQQAQTLRDEVGASVRPPANWIRLLANQVDDPAAAVEPWQQAIGQLELAAVDEPDDRWLDSHIADLLRNLVRVELTLGDADPMLETVDRLLEHVSADPTAELDRLLGWAVECQASAMVDVLLARYDEQLSGLKQGLYIMAGVRAWQGKSEQADELARRALEAPVSSTPVNNPQLRYWLADDLIDDGHVEWGRRELRGVIDDVPPGSEFHARAVMMLAQSLHDWQADEEASNVIASFTDLLRDNETLRNQ